MNADAEVECKTNPTGNGYRGRLNVSFAGHSCINWYETVASLVNVEDITSNYCRRVLNSPWNATSCMTTSDGIHQIEEKCNVEFCGKNCVIHYSLFQGL